MEEFDIAYETHSQSVYHFLYRLLLSEHEAYELTQETFVTFFKEARSGNLPKGRLRPWLFRVAKNKALNVMRSQQRFSKAKQKEERSESLLEFNTPERLLSQQQDIALVQKVLSAMQERESTLLQLYSSELSYEDMAQVMEMEKSSIGKTLARAKQSFRVLFQQYSRNR